MFEALNTPDKELAWVYDTTARWDGCLEFQRRPAPMLEWFDRHLR